MPRIQPVADELLDRNHADLLATIRGAYGSEPSSFALLAHVPGLLEAVGDLSEAVMGPGRIDAGLKWMVAHVASLSAGCQYCSAHTGYHAAHAAGVREEKVAALWDFATDPLFSRAERAALNLALGAAHSPNATTDADFDELRASFTDGQIAEQVAVVALFGLFNRWNDTLKPELEDAPLRFAEQTGAYAGRNEGRSR
ncbi:carboxymuconolactone decarboxylase family protein [Nocardioides marmoriginsengisoli]|uniref:Carboxymuconolactone decarboxylase family protein n=1 Tax=Nocardioides marmoriginsengisoli TaxID=661483 RepID=A0A3N0CGU4_9ACTN|nr:carboxymuconolactone decarboxylase family protein [Nocardioides marmoriginsengisoli]RNL62451.1 carboxymuconolactone decarboxylase family protein [Nocardioides marmoriginsengisoli]